MSDGIRTSADVFLAPGSLLVGFDIGDGLEGRKVLRIWIAHRDSTTSYEITLYGDAADIDAIVAEFKGGPTVLEDQPCPNTH